MTEDICYEYDIAVSFAGEDREYVRNVVRELQKSDVSVFYDEDNASEMWGENLVDFLQEVYGRRARFAVLFISRHYIEKKWTSHERQSAQDRALQQSSPYVLPVRLDDSELPGLHSTIGYLNAATVGTEGVVDAIKRKLGEKRTPVAPKFDGRAPRTSEAVSTLLAERPQGWEVLLFAGVLRRGIDALERQYNDHIIEYAPQKGSLLDDRNALQLMRSSFSSVQGTVGVVSRMFMPQVQTAAFGKLGEPGDPDRIIHMANRLVGVYEELMNWAADLRGTGIDNETLEQLVQLEAKMSDSPIEKIREFVDVVVASADSITEKITRDEPVDISIYLTIDVDDDIMREFHRLIRQYEPGS